MSDAITLSFESRLHASSEKVWEWITSVKGICAEMRPLLLMTVPKGIETIDSISLTPGKRMFRSYIFLLGFLPADYSDMTLLEIRCGDGFVEQSPMGSMRFWLHNRSIESCPLEPGLILLIY